MSECLVLDAAVVVEAASKTFAEADAREVKYYASSSFFESAWLPRLAVPCLALAAERIAVEEEEQ